MTGEKPETEGGVASDAGLSVCGGTVEGGGVRVQLGCGEIVGQDRWASLGRKYLKKHPRPSIPLLPGRFSIPTLSVLYKSSKSFVSFIQSTNVS